MTVKARGFLIGLDGVLVRDGEPLPGAVEALVRLRAMGLPFRILTNSSLLSTTDLSAWLLERGFSVDPEEIWIVGDPAADAFQRAARDLLLPPDAKIVMVGHAVDFDVAEALSAGLAVALVQPDDAPVPEGVDAVATDLNRYLYRLFHIR